MKNKAFSILFIFFSFYLFSQSYIQKLGEETCNCIHNNTKQISFDKKFETCLIPILVKETKINNTLNQKDVLTKMMLDIKKYVSENCEASISTNKFTKEELKKTSNDACKCIEKINYELESKYDSVKQCISNALILYQMTKSLELVNIDSTSTKIQPKKVNLLFQTNSNSKLYKQIEKDLVSNCNYLKIIINTDNNKDVNSVTFDREANKEYDIGLEFSQEKNYKEAIIHYKKAVAIDDKFAFAWDNLGIAYRRTNQLEKAINAYKMSLKANPKGRVPLMNLGVAYSQGKQYKKAIKYYKLFTEKFSKDPEGYFGLGKNYLFINKNEKALIQMIKALKIYTQTKSPYRADAETIIQYIYSAMKKNNNLDSFRKIMHENNINYKE